MKSKKFVDWCESLSKEQIEDMTGEKFSEEEFVGIREMFMTEIRELREYGEVPEIVLLEHDTPDEETINDVTEIWNNMTFDYFVIHYEWSNCFIGFISYLKSIIVNGGEDL